MNNNYIKLNSNNRILLLLLLCLSILLLTSCKTENIDYDKFLLEEYKKSVIPDDRPYITKEDFNYIVKTVTNENFFSELAKLLETKKSPATDPLNPTNSKNLSSVINTLAIDNFRRWKKIEKDDKETIEKMLKIQIILNKKPSFDQIYNNIFYYNFHYNRINKYLKKTPDIDRQLIKEYFYSLPEPKITLLYAYMYFNYYLKSKQTNAKTIYILYQNLNYENYNKLLNSNKIFMRHLIAEAIAKKWLSSFDGNIDIKDTDTNKSAIESISNYYAFKKLVDSF